MIEMGTDEYFRFLCWYLLCLCASVLLVKHDLSISFIPHYLLTSKVLQKHLSPW